MTLQQCQLVDDFIRESGIEHWRVLKILTVDNAQAEAALAWARVLDPSASRSYLFIGCKSNFLSQLTRSLAAEFGELAVRFNAIAIDGVSNHWGLHGIAAFLLSNDASYVTGVTVFPQDQVEMQSIGSPTSPRANMT